MLQVLLTVLVLAPISGIASERYIWPRADVHESLATLKRYELELNNQQQMATTQDEQEVASALDRLKPLVTPRLSRQDEAQLAGLINQFEGNQDAYLQIIGSLRRLNLDVEATRFERLTVGQAAWLLHAVGDLARSWSEVQPEVSYDGHEDDFVYAILGVRQPLIDDYLQNSLGRLAFIAQRYAAPLVLYLRRVDPDSLDAEVEDWHSLLVGLASFEDRDAASPIIVIERFLHEGIGELTQSNCAGRLGRLGNSIDTNGFFASYQYQVIDQARVFCRATRGN